MHRLVRAFVVRLALFTSIALPCELARAAAPSDAAGDSKPIPLTTLGSRTWHGKVGGLYAGGENEPRDEVAAAIERMTATIQPLDREGKPDPNGKIVVAGIGASVAVQVFEALEAIAPQNPQLSKHVVFVNCAKGGQDVNKIADPAGAYWKAALEALAKHDVTPAQVQVAWYQSDDLRDSRADFPGRPERLRDSYAGNMRLLKQHLPNVRICYHSARHTTAFGKQNDDPNGKHAEPRPYYAGWATKWLIEDQLKGRADLAFDGPAPVAPLCAWATYFWTNGDQKREGDGYAWNAEQVVADGVHLSDARKRRVADELLHFWLTDRFASRWMAATIKTTKKATPPPGEPVMQKATNATEPAWIVNGNDKIPKLQRLLGTTANVRVVVTNLDGKEVARIEDVFSKHTDLNALIGPGEFRVAFFDAKGERIQLKQVVGEVLLLK